MLSRTKKAESKTEDLTKKRAEIQNTCLDKLRDYLNMDLETYDSEVLKHCYNRARLSMQFEKEMNISKRANEMNFVRVGRLVTENKDELKKYLKRTLPQYS